MRRLVLVSALFLGLSCSSQACGPPEVNASAHLVPNRFIYAPGWEIPGLAGARIESRATDDSGSEVIVYKAPNATYVDLAGFEVSADGKSIQLVPGYQQVVDLVREYRVNGVAYSYTVITYSVTGLAHPPMWPRVVAPTKNTGKKHGIEGGIFGCGATVIHYFDSDGDGKFESLEYVGFGGVRANSKPCPTIPEWALERLPNRQAAERCESDWKARTTVSMEKLSELLNHAPPIPVLTPLPSGH